MTKKTTSNLKCLFFFPLAFVAIGLLIYSPALHAPFYLDDFHHLVGNPLFTSFHRIRELWLYEPARFLTHLSFLINISFASNTLPVLHLTSFFIHISNACLVSLLCSQMIRLTREDRYKKEISILAGLLFLVHPANSQAVIYISQRATLLATFFYLATAIFYLRYQMEKKSIDQVFSVCTCFLAMCCKEISITLPVALVLLHLALFKRSLREALRSSFPYLLLLFLIPLYYRYHHFSVSADVKQPDYFITQIRVAVTYLRLFIFPTSLRLEYDYPIYTSFLAPQILMAVSFFVAFFSLSILNFKKRPFLLCAGLFFLLALAPDSSFIALNDVIFEHRFYLPTILMFCVISQSIFSFFRVAPLRLFVILIIVTCFCLATFTRAKQWSNPIVFFKNDIRLSPKNDRSYANLGHYFLTIGDVKNAEHWFQRTLSVNPNNSRAYNNLGMIAKDRGLFDEALTLFQRTIEIEPDLAQPHFSIGLIHHDSGDYQAAVAEFEIAQAKDPAYLYAYLGAAHSFLFLNEYVKAHQALDYVLGHDRKNLLAHYLKGKIFMQQSQWGEAEKHLLLLLNTPLTDPDVVNMLIEIYEKTNAPEKAKIYKTLQQQSPAI